MHSTKILRLVRSLVLGLVAAWLSAGLANARTYEGTFTLPFEARWGGVTLAPGDYSFILLAPFSSNLLSQTDAIGATVGQSEAPQAANSAVRGSEDRPESESSTRQATSPAGKVLTGPEASAARFLKVTGKVSSVQGEVFPGATVWIAPFASPAEHLAEARTSAAGEFSLEARLDAQRWGTNRFVVGASHRECLESRELLEPVESADSSNMTLLLRRSGESFEDPNLDLIDDWLLPNLAHPQLCRLNAGASCKVFEAALGRYRKQPSDWSTLERVLLAAQETDLPEARLLAALALLRVGAWEGAGKMLAASGQKAAALPERFLLEGVRWNLLRRPEEARRNLEQALRDEPRSALIEIELGRAAVLAEDWPTAAHRLNFALRDRALAPYARYLRARSLMAQGDLEGAAREAKILGQRLGRKRLPIAVQAFMADIQQRLEEGSIQPLAAVMSQPVTELQKTVSDLNSLDSASSPPPGGLEEFLKQVGISIETFFRDFSSTAATEVIRQTQLDKKGRPRAVRNQEFYYVFLHRWVDGRPWVEEYRATYQGQASGLGGTDAGYMATSGFASSLIVLHPTFQTGTSYRFLGRQTVGDRPAYVIGFAQRPEESMALGQFHISQANRTASLYLQGIAWIAADRNQVLRLRTDLLHAVPEIQLSRLTAEVDYSSYHFLSSPRTFCLPNRVTVSVEWGRNRLRNEHIFSRFRLFKVDVDTEAAGGGNKVAAASKESSSN